jgi:regulator of sirC expression with transglutaminase-like and TPR domain
VVETELARLDGMAAELAPGVKAARPGQARARALLHGVNDQLGFRGNHEHYYDPSNSYLNLVLARRVGLPILLCVVCMALGRRLDMVVEGMGFPGHFMARYRQGQEAWLLDPFHQALIAPEEAPDYLSRLFNRPVMLSASAFVPVTPVALAQRILNNLRNVYLGSEDYDMAARVVDHMLALTPASVYLWQERGMIAYRAGELEQAARALRRYFFLIGRLHLLLPERGQPPTEVTDGTRHELAQLAEADRQLMLLAQEVDRIRLRLN